MILQCDVAVVGAGIVGLAHAWRAAERGLRVVVCERSSAAQGASIRNFGMIWPIGQPAGERHALALQAAEFWRQLAAAGVLPVEPCGSIHLAHRDDELAVLEEFCELATHPVRMLTPAEVTRRSTLANPQELRAGMLSDTELRVDPRLAVARIAAWLAERHGVEFHFATPVVAIDAEGKPAGGSGTGGAVRAADGRVWQAERIVVCSGSELRMLYPEYLAGSGLRRCKLQMLSARAGKSLPPASPHLASGLTLRHYPSFADCPSLGFLRARIAEETPELDRFGIHVMASVSDAGDVLLGDSHEYDQQITPFDKVEIDQLMLRELRKVIQLSDWTIHQHWHGIYAKHEQQIVFEAEPDPGVHIFTGTGGAGMTLSFGLAERAWKRWLPESQCMPA